jgi:hypothetical protein
MAPFMNRKMIRFAFAGKCGGFGARSPGLAEDDPGSDAPRTFEGFWPSNPARARYPNPVPALLRICRRLRPSGVASELREESDIADAPLSGFYFREISDHRFQMKDHRLSIWNR